MPGLLAIVEKVIGWGLFLGVAYLSYRFIWKDSLPNLVYKGWGTLQPTYAVAQLPTPRFTTSARVGSEVYQGTMQVALAAHGLYLQVPTSSAMYIPYGRFRLVAKPKARTAFFSLGTYGIFTVDGVDIWLDQPYAGQLIAHLQP